MSKFEAPLSKFELSVHPNADTLSIGQVGGWQVVCKTEEFVNETLAIYLPLDSIADETHPLLSFLKGQRVKTCKLRGVISQGLLLPFSKVKEYMKNTLEMSDESIEKVSVEGKDFSGILRVKRWHDDSVKLARGGDAEAPDPNFHKYTDIENFKNFRNVIKLGEPVFITEKLHGSSGRWSLIDDKFMIGSRKLQLKIDSETKTYWHFIFEKYKLKYKLSELRDRSNNKNVAIYGEIVGPKIQDLHYGQKEPALFVYDLMVDGQYLPPRSFQLMCASLELPTVPILKVGELQERDFDLRSGKSMLAEHVREGIVIEPLENRWNEQTGRTILKLINEEFLLRKNAKDVNDI